MIYAGSLELDALQPRVMLPSSRRESLRPRPKSRIADREAWRPSAGQSDLNTAVGRLDREPHSATSRSTRRVAIPCASGRFDWLVSGTFAR
jgi:hypothetical protein